MGNSYTNKTPMRNVSGQSSSSIEAYSKVHINTDDVIIDVVTITKEQLILSFKECTNGLSVKKEIIGYLGCLISAIPGFCSFYTNCKSNIESLKSGGDNMLNIVIDIFFCILYLIFAIFAFCEIVKGCKYNKTKGEIDLSDEFMKKIESYQKNSRSQENIEGDDF